MESRSVLRAAGRDVSRYWWLFIVSGILWLMISLVVLRFNETSVTTIGVLIGVVFTVAAVTELVVAGAMSGGWMVIHWLLSVVFLLGAIWGYANPKDAFWALADVLGFILVIYGTIEITEAVASRHMNELWWLGLTAGILLVLLGFWTGQQLLEVKAELLIFYVGLFAFLRGIEQVAFAFSLRHAARELEDA